MCFSDEEVITVGSSAYNLAGDVASRDNFMKNNILSMIFSGTSKEGLGKGIVDAHIAGPATAYSRFYKWAESSGYNTQVGNLGGLIYSAGAITTEGFQFLVPVKATHDQRAISFTTSAMDLNLVALEWIIKNSPANRSKTFKATLEKSPGFLGTLTGKILITYSDNTTVTFTPTYNLTNNMPMVYLYHEERLKLSQVVTDTGWLTASPPAKVGFTGSPVTVAQNIVRNKTTTTVTSYSNGTPTNTSVNNEAQNLAFNKITGKYTKVTTIVATPTVVGKVTTLVQDEESFYNALTSSSTSSSSEIIQETYGSNLFVAGAADTYINSVGAIVTPSPSAALSMSGKIPISSGQTLSASSGPGGAGWGYVALYNASDVYIAGSATGSNVISHMAGATYARFSFFTSNASFYEIKLLRDVTVTTTVTVVTPYLEVYWKYKQVSTAVSQEKWLPYLLTLYQKGTSTPGDSLLFNSPVAIEKFFPVIPLRRDNVMVDAANFPTQYGWNRKASRKAFGSKRKYDLLIDSLTNNPSLSDIDHAWVIFGVSLSTQQQDGQKYLYEFFKNLSDTTISATGTYKSASAFAAAWAAFILAKQQSTNDSYYDHYVGPTPVAPVAPVAQEYTLTVNATAGLQDWLYNTTISARGGNQVVGSGYHAKSQSKIGQSWVYAKSTITISVPTYDNEGSLSYSPSTTTVIAFGKQITADIWAEYEFFDLVHTNNVHQGITAVTLGTTAIASANENSSFVIPLHQAVFTDLNLVRRTQLSLECAFLVINYYNKQTIPWYASGFFQIIVVVVIIVVTVYSGGITGSSAGVLGTNATVGAKLGFALGSTAAIVAGAIANAVAAAIVASLITKVAVSALGEDVGRIVGAIASMVAINLMSSTGPFNLADSWAQMTKADNLLKLTMSGVQQYGSFMQGQAMELNAETQALMLESNKALEDINRLTQELLGDSGIDPTTITDAIRYATENPAQFFNRTTMTGTEIAELSIKLVEDFPAPQLALPYLD